MHNIKTMFLTDCLLIQRSIGFVQPTRRVCETEPAHGNIEYMTDAVELSVVRIVQLVVEPVGLWRAEHHVV